MVTNTSNKKSNKDDSRWIMDGHVLTKESSEAFEHYINRAPTQKEIDFVKECDRIYIECEARSKNTSHQSCSSCNNRLTEKDISLIYDMASWNVDAGGHLRKDEWIALRRLKALRGRV